MNDRLPIVRASALYELDDDELIEGYIDGRAGEPEPGDNRSYSYWHGWKNGAVDGGHRKIDTHQQQLIDDLIERGYLKGLFKLSK